MGRANRFRLLLAIAGRNQTHSPISPSYKTRTKLQPHEKKRKSSLNCSIEKHFWMSNLTMCVFVLRQHLEASSRYQGFSAMQTINTQSSPWAWEKYTFIFGKIIHQNLPVRDLTYVSITQRWRHPIQILTASLNRHISINTSMLSFKHTYRVL